MYAENNVSKLTTKQMPSATGFTYFLGLTVLVENENVTDWFNKANVTDEHVSSNVTISKKNITQIEVSFKSGKCIKYEC